MPTGRASRSYPELKLPLPAHLAAALPLVFVQDAPPLTIPAADLASPAFCSSLSIPTAQAIPRHLRVYLELMLEGAVSSDWLSGLELHWRPHFLALFSTRAQRRLRALDLLDTSPTLNPVDLIGKQITAVHDLTVMLGLLSPGPAPRVSQPLLELDLQAELALPRKRLQATFLPLEAPEKWRPDPLAAITFVFSDQVAIEHTDCRYAWLVHLLCNHGPSNLFPPGQQSINFPVICDSFPTPELQAVAHALRDLISCATAMTVQAEIEDIAARTSRTTRNRARTTSQITMRYGCDGTVRSLGDLGNFFSVSRQVVHNQIALARSLCTKSDFVPALRRLVAAIDEQASQPIDDVERTLRPLLGPTQSLEGALQFAKEFFGLAPATRVYAARPAGAPGRIKFVGEQAAHRTLAIGSFIQHILLTQGFAYIPDLLATRAKDPSFDPTFDELNDAITQDPSILWLGSDQRWLLWRDPNCPLVVALRQMAHVAHPHPLSVESAAEGLRVALDRDHAGIQPSSHLLRAAVVLLAPAAGLTVQADAVVLPSDPAPLTLIPRAQLRVYEALVELGGFALPDAIHQAIPGLSDFSAVDMRRRIATCCFVAVHPPGYLLRGWPEPQLMASAAGAGNADRRYSVDGPVVHTVLTNSAASRVKLNARLIYLPSPLPDLIHGVFTHAERLWPDILVKAGRVHQLAPIATAIGVSPGSVFQVDFDLSKRTYRLSPIAPSGQSLELPAAT